MLRTVLTHLWHSGEVLYLTVSASSRLNAATMGFFDPAELLEDLLTIRDAPVYLLSWNGGQKQGVSVPISRNI